MNAKVTTLSKAGVAARHRPWPLLAIAAAPLALALLGTFTPSARAAAGNHFAPTGLSATAAGSSQVNLTWTAPLAASSGDYSLSGYDIYEGSGTSSTAISTVSPTATSYTVNDLASGTSYDFEVEAAYEDPDVCTDGRQCFSSEASARTYPTYPTPTGLIATAASGLRATLTWTAPDAPDLPSPGYDIYEGTSPGGESSTPVNTGPVTATSYTITGLTSGTTYYFDVIALYPGSGDCQLLVCTQTASAPSNETSVTAAIGSLSTTRGTSTGTPTSPSQESNRAGTPGGGPTGTGKPSGHRKRPVIHDRSARTTGRTEPAGGTVPLLAILMAVTLVVLAAGLIFRWHQLRSGPSLPPQASVKAVTRAGPPAAVRIQTTGTGLAHAVRIEPYAGTRTTTIEEVRS
jgi:Fibronectin type III domain